MMLRNQRLLTVNRYDGGSDGGVPVVEFEVDCAARSDITSKTNAVTIAVNKADLIEVRTEIPGREGQTYEN